MRLSLICSEMLASYTWGAIIQPFLFHGGDFSPTPYQGQSEGQLVAILGTNDEKSSNGPGLIFMSGLT